VTLKSPVVAFPLRKNIVAITGYSPGEQPQDGEFIKLNTNENPYPPSPRVLKALRKAINPSLRLYPDPLADGLRDLAASVYGGGVANVLAGNGSDELLGILARCLVGKGDRVVYPVPTYTLYDTLIAIQDGEKVTLDYPPDFTLPEKIFSESGSLTIIANPNSPSGTLISLEQIERLARSVSGVLVVDEAYIDFADVNGITALPLVHRHSNLVVLRSFSKAFSLAGMRVGLAFAPEEIIQGMIKTKDSYNLNSLSLVSAAAALGDLPWMSRNVKRVQRTRKKLTQSLKRLGFTVYPSQANFVLVRKQGENLRWIYEELKRRKILVRYFDVPVLRDTLRITVGTPKETDVFLRELATLLESM
jgi:histidinol-phosphate aminotransferase